MGAMWLCGRVACASNVSKISAPVERRSHMVATCMVEVGPTDIQF